MKRSCVVVLVLAAGFLGCEPNRKVVRKRSSGLPRSEEQPPAAAVVPAVASIPSAPPAPATASGVRQVPADQAEAVLVVEVAVPGGDAPKAVEFPLARKAGAAAGGGAGHSFSADGLTADGKGYGHTGTVSLTGGSADAVTARVAVAWTDRKGGKGEADGAVEVPWQGKASKELAKGVTVTAAFRPAK